MKQEEYKSPFGTVPMLTTQADATGIEYDFNYGLQIKFPQGEGDWTLRVYDDDSGDLLVSQQVPSGASYTCPYKYYIKYRVEAHNELHAFSHTMNLKGQVVAFKMAHKTLGDCIAYMSQLQHFVQLHQCKPIVYLQQWAIDLFKFYAQGDYPWDLRLLEDEDASLPYATYYIGLVFDRQQGRYWQKYPIHQKGLQFQAAHILGLDTGVEPAPPTINEDFAHPLPTKNKYVCIGFSGSKQCKFWNNATGWREVIAWLKSNGYDVVCIDRDFTVGMPGSFMSRPEGCIDLIGNHPLSERAAVISGAEFFIGVASGLSWLAWACHVPVVMISGFSRPDMEFYTPYRVFNERAECTDCWGDGSIAFNHHDWAWCPRIDTLVRAIDKELEAAKTEQEVQMTRIKRNEALSKKFICTQAITGTRVINMIKKLISDKEQESYDGKTVYF